MVTKKSHAFNPAKSVFILGDGEERSFTIHHSHHTDDLTVALWALPEDGPQTWRLLQKAWNAIDIVDDQTVVVWLAFVPAKDSIKVVLIG
jgi:hypothetical protein